MLGTASLPERDIVGATGALDRRWCICVLFITSWLVASRRKSVYRMRLLNVTGAIALATVLLAGCGSASSSGGSVPVTPGAPQLPVSAAFATTSETSPTTSAGATSMTVPLPPSTGYSGQAIFPVASVPANLHLTISYTDRAPAGISALATLHQSAAGRRSVLDVSSTDVVYGCFAANYLVDVNGAPQFSFTLPPGFAQSSVVYNLAIEQDGQWTTGYGGPGTIVATTGSATVAVAGRFGFTIPANGRVCVALYGRLTTASTPVPATPAPSPSASPTPSASPHPSTSPTPSASPTPTVTPTPSASPTPTATPTPTPTATPSPAPLTISPATVSLLGTGSSFAQSASVHEASYTGAFSIAATACASVATISPSTASGPTVALTITGLAVGTCTATATDTHGQMALLQITVTTSNVGVDAVQRTP
jgi:hypothetical protein